MSSHGECITIHIGQAGCQIGRDCWELFCHEHCVKQDGTRDKMEVSALGAEQEDTTYSSFFSETHAGQHVPRSIFVDTDPSTRDEILASDWRKLFHPESILGYKQDCKNIFFEGRFMAAHCKIKEDVMDRVRLAVDLCSNLQGFFVLHSFGGGTGSGVGCEVLHDLHEAFDKKVIFQPVLYPSHRFSSSIVEPYNCIFSTFYMRDVVDVSLMLDNEATYRVCETNLNIKSPHFTHVNRLIAQTISACTTSLRFETQLHATLVEIVTNLVPTQHFRYPMVSLAPVRAKAKEDHECFSEQEIVTELFESKSVLCDVTHLKQNRYLASVVLLRGVGSRPKTERASEGYTEQPVEANHVITALHTLKDGTHRSPLKFAPWVSSGFKVGLVGVAPTIVPADTHMAKTGRQGAMLGNSTAVRQLFVRQYTKYLKLFYRRAYVWQFIEANGEIDLFYEAREGVRDIIGHYEELLRQCAQAENERYDGNTIVKVEGMTSLVGGAGTGRPS
ncbi:unnamed protein product [Effrenium voratum]|uniref:Tubulin alpha chain n=1 Tax=Effrenium voratum TaxID=2562239 RepID=A0AA36JGT6_9DINO|nr:unnamed protein product [Effrenium voratum]CAJ1405947.1 unnamed protein product [Effrenium voratum]CAJ1437355.1 unnamed protein product [Effrenium voratum]|mmetsp:Transcript_94560/g.225347  ORF Transcript_94560/g.225347 Transcript_94560/m.225347 type:complete len:502 (-) Transcript_94560:39-1544(-)